MLDAACGDLDYIHASIPEDMANKQEDGSSLDNELQAPAQNLRTWKDISTVLHKQVVEQSCTTGCKEKRRQGIIEQLGSLPGTERMSQSTSQTTSGPTTPTCENSEDEIVDLTAQDMQIPSLNVNDDLLKASKGQLMVMLNDITEEFRDDDVVSSVTFSAVPRQTRQEKIPIEIDAMSAVTFSAAPPQSEQEQIPAQALLQECNVMWEEVQAEAEQKRELHSRLLGELKQMQERSDRQQQETSSLIQRLMSAKQMLKGKLRDASLAKQDLCGRIRDECRVNERLQIAISENEQVMLAHAAKLDRQLCEVSEQHASLREEVQAATESQAHLELELQNERFATRQHCTDLVVSLARGNPQPANLSAFDPSKHQTKSKQEVSEEQLSTKGSISLGDNYVDSEEQVHLQRKCCVESQRIKDLREELALEEAVRSQYLVQLEDAATQIASSGLQLRGNRDIRARMPLSSVCLQEDVGIDVASQVHDAVSLSQELEDKENQCRRVAEKVSKAQDQHQAEQEKLSTLHARVLQGQFECEDRAREIVQSNECQEKLCCEIEVERAAYRQERHLVRERLQLARAQVQEKRAELVHWKETNRRLALDLQRTRGCLFPGRRAGKGTPRKNTPSKGGIKFADTIGRPTSASRWLNG